MQPRTLQQVLTELDGVYNPQIDNLRQRQSAIPGQIQAEEQGLQAKQQTAFGEILNGARRRGTGVAFGGIPLQEQSRYTADNHLPALARLRQSGREQAMSLEDAILGIQERRMTQGQGVYQNEQQMAEQRRQFDQNLALQREQMAAQQRAAAASAFSPTMGGGTSIGAATQGKAQAIQKSNKGFAFTDQFGNPISAAAYAAGTGIPFRQLLQTMANQGDAGAKKALGFVGDDFGYNPGKVDMNLYNSLVWGTGRQASAPQAPKPVSYTPNKVQGINPLNTMSAIGVRR